MNWDFMRHAFPSAAEKQKAKEGLVGWGGALFYPSVKRSPCAFGFCVRLVCAGCLSPKDSFGEEKKAFVSFGPQKKEIHFFVWIRV